MLCPYCNSNNITNLKVFIPKPVGMKRMKCLCCKKTFITTHVENNKRNNLIDSLKELL